MKIVEYKNTMYFGDRTIATITFDELLQYVALTDRTTVDIMIDGIRYVVLNYSPRFNNGDKIETFWKNQKKDTFQDMKNIIDNNDISIEFQYEKERPLTESDRLIDIIMGK